jgi:ubiquinone/menaquinone biosynthesis C-methylase UbiE
MTDAHRIATWYDQNAALEHERLTSCRLEFSISWRIITQHLDQLGRDRALEILDLGGGTGRYG